MRTQPGVVRAAGVTFAFPRERPVLDGVDLEVGREVVALTGTSGTGKTTLLLCLAGILVPEAGSIEIAGQRLDGTDLEGRNRLRRERMGLVFQFSELIAELTLLENVALPLELLGSSRKSAITAAGGLLGELGISSLAGRYPAQVSGGQAQRAAVARALVHEPAVVLADEPTGALDGDNGERVLELLLDAASRRDAAVVLVTHDAAVAAHADRVVDMGALKGDQTGARRGGPEPEQVTATSGGTTSGGTTSGGTTSGGTARTGTGS